MQSTAAAKQVQCISIISFLSFLVNCGISLVLSTYISCLARRDARAESRSASHSSHPAATVVLFLLYFALLSSLFINIEVCSAIEICIFLFLFFSLSKLIFAAA